MARFVLLFLTFSACTLYSQLQYPFDANSKRNEITAYWYNVPDDSLPLPVMKQALPFRSTLELYGYAPSDSFVVSVSAHAQSGKALLGRTLTVKKGGADPAFRAQWRGRFFKLIIPVPRQATPPSAIKVAIESGGRKLAKEIICRYHKLSGTITDFEGKPFRAVVVVRPDDFDGSAGVWSDAEGHYSVVLPERIYSNIFVDDETYGLETAEAWGWHIIMDADQTIDFKVGTGEVYNLNVWPNNGGARTYFVSFRPMSVFFYRNTPPMASVTVEGKTVDVLDVGAHLKADEIAVRFNGKEAPIVSLQKYFEWTSGRVMPAYLVQVSRDGLENIGKQTVTVEYRSESDLNGKRVVHTSLGVFQFYANFTGLSFF